MDVSLFAHLAAGNAWGTILPELSLACLALALLALEIVLPKRAHGAIPAAALLGQAAVLLCVLLHFHAPYLGRETFNGLLRPTPLSQAMRIFFLLSSLFVCLIARIGLTKQAVPRTEFYHVVLVVTAALMLLAQSYHFVMLFVTLETVTIGFYILVSYFRDSAATLEAGLKYLVMGALSSALLLFGIALLYGVAGNRALPGHTAAGMNYGALGAFLAANPHCFLAGVGIVLVLAGLGFKIGAFPFQFWIPDVYQGAPTPVTAFLAVASKAAGFIALLVLVLKVFTAYLWLVSPALAVMAGATIIFGNLAALPQRNVKRLIGLSGVSHAGFLLLGVAAAPRVPLAVGALFFYLIAYLIGSFAVFGVMAHLAGADDANQNLDDYAGLARRHPFLGAVLAIGLASLAGIPPLAGFMGKFFIFYAAFLAGQRVLLAIAIGGVVVSIYYYFGWIKAAFFDLPRPIDAPAQQQPAPIVLDRLTGVALGVLAAGAIVLGFYQGIFGHWLTR